MFLFLRDPVERVISHFIEHKNNRYSAPDVTLEEMFLEKPDNYFGPKYPLPAFSKRAGFHGNSVWASNFYCRALTKTGFGGPNPYPITINIADDIIKNIENNTLFYNGKHVPCIFGVTERFKESTDLFAKLAGWKNTNYREKSPHRAYNKGKRKYPASDKLVEAIAKYNQLDTRIYNAACKQFDAQVEFFKGTNEGNV